MERNSIGLIELTSIAAGYQAADAMLKAAEVDIILSRTICSGKYMVLIGGDVAAVKAARIQLIEIRLAMALGGKAFLTLTGDVAACQAAVDAGAAVVAAKGLLVNKVVIPQPRRELLNEIV